MLNPNGRSYPFDEKGSGYGRGEGIATLVIKRLDDAVASNDPIRALIRNTGVNQDGKSQGITMPNSDAQRKLITKVYSEANIDPASIRYVEAHGTGTSSGDEAEIRSICGVFCSEKRTSPLHISSVKSNIGHLEASSGLAGLIKAVLVLEKGVIPPMPDFATIKSQLQIEPSMVSVRLD
jgi:acyl transferase domain-containing protein